MKRIVSLALALLLCAAMIGCGSSAGADIDARALGEALYGAGLFDDIVTEMPEAVAAKVYGYEDGDVSECVLYQSTMAATEEIFVAKCADASAAAKVKAGCEARIASQIEAYTDYVPAEIPKLNAAVLRVEGDTVIFVVSNDAAAANAVIDGFVEG